MHSVAAIGLRSPFARSSLTAPLLAIRVVMMMVVMMVMVVVTNDHDNLRRQRQGSGEAEHESKSEQNLFHKLNTLRPSL
jgi:hypothetical protein